MEGEVTTCNAIPETHTSLAACPSESEVQMLPAYIQGTARTNTNILSWRPSEGP